MRGDGFNVALEYEEVFGFDEDVVGCERGIVDGVGHDAVVEFVFRGSGRGDPVGDNI